MKRLEQYIVKGGKKLRLGYTTGSCAAAAAKGAAQILLGGETPASVFLDTPAGICLELQVEQIAVEKGCVSCAVRKDAGDDPDVTHGALISAAVSKIPEGFQVLGGQGVGRVTLPGLPVEVGEAAINPVPMKMIRQGLEDAAKAAEYAGGLQAVISVAGGEELAGKTFNPRLGIVGGISILGTSGIVEPMSEAALVATIKSELEARRARGEETLLLAPGNYGQDFIQNELGIDPDRIVKCSNYIGEALDHGVYLGFRQILLAGHAGKLIKLAAGIMNTHSRMADGRREILAAHGAMAGLDREQVTQLFSCVTVDGADELLEQWNVREQVWGSVGKEIVDTVNYRLGKQAAFGFAAFCARGMVMKSGEFDRMLQTIK